MFKNFWDWHRQKNLLELREKRLYFHEREIWWCNLGLNIGFEQDGKGNKYLRPVIIFRKFNNEVFWAIPLTTKKKNNRFYFKIDNKNSFERFAILSQLKLMDAKRLHTKDGKITKSIQFDLQKALINICQGF